MSREQAEALAQQYGINYYDTSSKLNIGLIDSFEDLFEQSYKSKFNVGGGGGGFVN